LNLLTGINRDWQSTQDWQTAKNKAKILKSIRVFFDEKSVIEVETPLLSKGTITDVHLDAFTTRYDFLSDTPMTESTQYYLQTSPEFAMKRLIASGYGSIYQICKAFRHEDYGSQHNPEFTMLEWYRIDFDHVALMDEVSELLKLVLGCSSSTKHSYQELFIRYIKLDPLVASAEQLLDFINTNGLMSDWISQETNVDTLLQFVFSEVIEKEIGLVAPCFVYNFPRSQASLAKICPEDNRVAQRFECYYKGIELANGFNELTDATLQYQRFIEDNKKRKMNGLKEREIDLRFISALESGLPQCSGVALGVDRLVMLALKIAHIEQALTFPIERA